MDTLLSIALGIGLAAAAGLRVFVPIFGAGLAAHAGVIEVSPSFGWIATMPALIAFGTATALEIVAYYVPWLDHLLDVIASPAAVVAGVVASAAVMTDLPPLVTWTVALIGGGGVAGTMQLLSVGARFKSTVTTGGIANPVVATGEAAGAIALTAVAILVPIIALACCFVLGFHLLRLARRRRGSRAAAS